MAAQLSHTVIPALDKEASATFLAEILGLQPPKDIGPALCVQDGNGVELDFVDTPSIGDRYGSGRGHYAFLLTDEEFDATLARINERGIRFWADSSHQQEGMINNHGNGRGFHFEDPSGHAMEVLTVPNIFLREQRNTTGQATPGQNSALS